ncbi:Cof-type HAD-IIB family hydrolase [uncultured Sphingomonas sp.]|uniref:Cof-type HAD-IIB family hydrolase n=1 Tax=uncultured Sphingomonas sp. TaxID=158754 RepID=UPI0026028B00|nr:Cof-type HAD-IIB family hydrolase [uncultured Sphingomonas sp.]
MLVVCDVDGTLVDGQKRLTGATIAAVARLRAAGIRFTIISARPMSGMMPLAEQLALDLPMGAFNGGLIFRRDAGVAEHHTIAPEVARGVFDLIGDAAVDRWVFADDRWYGSTDRGVHVAHERLASAQNMIVRDTFDDLLDHADKITFVSDDAVLLATLAEKVKPFAMRATIVQSQTYYLDITALPANKGAGIAALAQAIGVPLKHTVAIGDQANDLAMFERAGRSIAMGNATGVVKGRANDVTTGNDADGVAHAIDNLILGRMM